MKILCTFPGKFGDLLWALPSLRALSRRIGSPVDLCVAAPFASICPLIEAQDYIGRCRALPEWQVQDTAPMTPRIPPGREDVISPYDLTLHLGYRWWPRHPLPFETQDCLNAQPGVDVVLHGDCLIDRELQLEEPWITVPAAPYAADVAVGFTDEHFELKYGLTRLIARQDWSWQSTGSSPRWRNEGGASDWTWERSAAWIRGAKVFLGCCSALHVLAVAVGTPVVLMEPSEARWNSIFYPVGVLGPQVTLVLGGDGRPTWDSRHVAETLEKVLEGRR